MTDSEALRSKIKSSGLLYKYIAQRLGLSYYGFIKKVDNLSEFKASEIATLADILQLSEAERTSIFFAA